MTPAEIRDLSEAELVQKVEALRQQLFQFRVQAKLGRLDKAHQVQLVRKDIARCLTIQRARRTEAVVTTGKGRS